MGKTASIPLFMLELSFDVFLMLLMSAVGLAESVCPSNSGGVMGIEPWMPVCQVAVLPLSRNSPEFDSHVFKNYQQSGEIRSHRATVCILSSWYYTLLLMFGC